MKTTITHNGHDFELVERIPVNYRIWNIGKHMIDGYLPLCELLAPKLQPFDGGCSINIETLKAIKIDTAQDILANIGVYGTQNPIKLQKKLDKHLGNPKYNFENKRTVNAIPLIKQVAGWENLK